MNSQEQKEILIERMKNCALFVLYVLGDHVETKFDRCKAIINHGEWALASIWDSKLSLSSKHEIAVIADVSIFKGYGSVTERWCDMDDKTRNRILAVLNAKICQFFQTRKAFKQAQEQGLFDDLKPQQMITKAAIDGEGIAA